MTTCVHITRKALQLGHEDMDPYGSLARIGVRNITEN